MPSYKSKSQKRSKSQSQSKNGGRHRKRTLKNMRRRKSRKVMMGGGLISCEKLEKQLLDDGTMVEFLSRYNANNGKSFRTFDEFKTEYKTFEGFSINGIMNLVRFQDGEPTRLANSISALKDIASQNLGSLPTRAFRIVSDSRGNKEDRK